MRADGRDRTQYDRDYDAMRWVDRQAYMRAYDAGRREQRKAYMKVYNDARREQQRAYAAGRRRLLPVAMRKMG